jgi:type I site-specific restriction-modification system R (restriction) subunit
MLTIAARILETPQREKPTIIILIERNELESQMFQNITSYGINGFRLAGSKRELQDILASDYRGLVLSMIHKFDLVPARLNTRKSVIVLVDEAHRTTDGDLGNYLMGALPYATYIGFTGTPIEELNAILDRAVELKEIMKAPDRVDKIARYIADHFRENVNPMGFKAFLVAVDRQACALYKQALDKYLPPDWSEVVYSPSQNDSAGLKKYYLAPDAEKK